MNEDNETVEESLESKPNRIYIHDLVEEVSDALNVKQEVIKTILEAIIDEIRSNLARGNEVMLKNLGKFGFKNYTKRKNHLSKSGTVGGMKIPNFRYARGVRQSLSVRDEE
jgi:nucleoid DNA-binding protein